MKNKVLIRKAVQALIEICSDAHDLGEDLDENGKIINRYRKAYIALDKMEKAGLVKFVEKDVYSKILKVV